VKILEELGVDNMQGYGVVKPRPLGELNWRFVCSLMDFGRCKNQTG